MVKSEVTPVTKITKLTALFLAVFFMTSVLTSCQKTPSDTKNFSKIASSMGYDVLDISNQYTNAESIKVATVAAPKSRKFQIEFYELTDMESAIKIYSAQSDILESLKTSGASSEVTNGRNYAKRILTVNGQYMLIEYIENTIIYIPPTDVENQKDVEKFLEKFKY